MSLRCGALLVVLSHKSTFGQGWCKFHGCCRQGSLHHRKHCFQRGHLHNKTLVSRVPSFLQGLHLRLRCHYILTRVGSHGLVTTIKVTKNSAAHVTTGLPIQVGHGSPCMDDCVRPRVHIPTHTSTLSFPVELEGTSMTSCCSAWPMEMLPSRPPST